MDYEMNIYYKDRYKTWIKKNVIKIGETGNWSKRYKMYIENYGMKYSEMHKNYPTTIVHLK